MDFCYHLQAFCTLKLLLQVKGSNLNLILVSAARGQKWPIERLPSLRQFESSRYSYCGKQCLTKTYMEMIIPFELLFYLVDD
jgi:hypothetical protein